MTPYNFQDFTFQPGLTSTTFICESGISYYAYFTDVSDYGIKIHSFGFEPIGIDMDGDFPSDRRIPDTIATILDYYFSIQEHNIIIYYPYNDDSRRLRLFNFWLAESNIQQDRKAL